jgi:hypothetical protein
MLRQLKLAPFGTHPIFHNYSYQHKKTGGKLKTRIVGIDFSGAEIAGKTIWIASGQILAHTLRIDDLRPGFALPGSGRDRGSCYQALRRFIGNERDAIIGMDFPFGLPKNLVKTETWDEFVLTFNERFPSADAFMKLCHSDAGGKELKRETDVKTKTPFSCYNLRLFKQTYFGIGDVLEPLVAKGSVSVLPMQQPDKSKPWVVEICPGSTLKALNLYIRYKGKKEEHKANRNRILNVLQEQGSVVLNNEQFRNMALDDKGGDALDSLIAAFAVYRNYQKSNLLAVQVNPSYGLEGYVYV